MRILSNNQLITAVLRPSISSQDREVLTTEKFSGNDQLTYERQASTLDLNAMLEWHPHVASYADTPGDLFLFSRRTYEQLDQPKTRM